jgi:hypothetical protein
VSARRSLEDLRSRTRFEPREAEPRLLAEWLASGVFHPAPLAGENYSIAFPPASGAG